MFDMTQTQERVILVGVQLSDGDDTQASLDELQELADTAGAVTVGRIVQNREKPHPGTYLGKGKIEELKEIENSKNNVDVAVDTQNVNTSVVQNTVQVNAPVVNPAQNVAVAQARATNETVVEPNNVSAVQQNQQNEIIFG